MKKQNYKLKPYDRKCMTLLFLAILFGTVWGVSYSFAAIIGKNTDGTTDKSDDIGRGYGSVDRSQGWTYTAVAGDAITEFSWRGNWGTDATNLTIDVAAYEVINDTPGVRAHVATSITVSSGTTQWWNSAAVDLSLTPGQEYCVVWTVSGGTHSYVVRRTGSTAGDSTSQDFTMGGTLPDPFDHFNILDITFSVYATVTNTPAATGATRIIGKTILGKGIF